MTPRTRLATADDIPRLVDVINRAYIAEAPFVLGLRTDRVNLHERLATPNNWCIVIETTDSNGQVPTIAGCVWIDCDGQRGHIGLLSVAPEMQGRGFGASLLRQAEALCAEKMACEHIELDVVSLREDLFPFYARMGYQRVGTVPFPDESRLKQPAHLVVMRRTK